MPLYEYQCTRCGARFERLQKLSDPPVTECPVCGGPVEKMVSSPAFQFKGSGWYVTDYARKPDSPSAPESKDATKDSGSGKTSGDKTASEKPASESKTPAGESAPATSTTPKPTG
jgi:putative FmdB family regulatory protein